MSPSVSVLGGEVEWTGDNPFIYLSSDAGESWSVLALMFRIAWSVRGAGNAILVLEKPGETAPQGDALAFCACDNEALARFLVEGFVPHFGVFRGQQGLARLEFVAARDFDERDGEDGAHEAACSTDTLGEVMLSWRQLRAPFAVDAPPPETATGAHRMLSVFRPADAASIVVGGRQLEGSPIERDFFGGRSLSAGLAFSESWIRVG